MPYIAASPTSARPDAQHDPPHRHMVELDDAVRDVERVVIGQRDDAGAEPDAPGALGGGGDEDLRRVDDLEPCRMMLADPGLLESQLVQPLDQLEVAPQR
jgi:hypothetical protein